MSLKKKKEEQKSIPCRKNYSQQLKIQIDNKEESTIKLLP